MKVKTARRPVRASTAGYRAENGALQDEHLPLRTMKLRMGTFK
jgi:hypothetical protein